MLKKNEAKLEVHQEQQRRDLIAHVRSTANYETSQVWTLFDKSIEAYR